MTETTFSVTGTIYFGCNSIPPVFWVIVILQGLHLDGIDYCDFLFLLRKKHVKS